MHALTVSMHGQSLTMHADTWLVS